MEQRAMTHFTKGLLIGLVIIVLYIAGYFTKMAEQAWFGWAVDLIIMAGMIWACILFANQHNNQVTFGNTFAHGFKTTSIVTLILIVYMILSLTIIFPEAKDRALEIARERMEAGGKMSQDQIDKGVEFTQKFFMPIAIGATLLSTLFFGAIGSLIGAGVAKKKPVNPIDQLGS
jgi:Protein of unknown function (DUF4199)